MATDDPPRDGRTEWHSLCIRNERKKFCWHACHPCAAVNYVYFYSDGNKITYVQFLSRHSFNLDPGQNLIQPAWLLKKLLFDVARSFSFWMKIWYTGRFNFDLHSGTILMFVCVMSSMLTTLGFWEKETNGLLLLDFNLTSLEGEVALSWLLSFSLSLSLFLGYRDFRTCVSPQRRGTLSSICSRPEFNWRPTA